MPQYIKDIIRKSSRYRAIANEENEKIRKWLDKQGHGGDDYILDQLIDRTEMGNDPAMDLLSF